MPRNMHFQHYAETRKVHNPKDWVWLFEFTIPSDPEQQVRLTNHDEPVPFGENDLGEPLMYVPAPIAHRGLPEPGDGSLPTVTLTMADPLRTIATLLDSHDGLEGQLVIVRVVHLDHLSLGDSAQELRAEIAGASASDDKKVPTASISITMLGMYKTAFPGRVYSQKEFPGIGA